MGFVILIIIIGAILILLVKSSEDRQREKEVHQKYLESQEAFENSIDQCKEECDLDLSEPEEEFHDWCRAYSADVIGYNIAGINFRHLDYSHIGEFDGTIRIEEGNPYDENAVAIYRGRKKVGYINETTAPKFTRCWRILGVQPVVPASFIISLTKSSGSDSPERLSLALRNPLIANPLMANEPGQKRVKMSADWPFSRNNRH